MNNESAERANGQTKGDDTSGTVGREKDAIYQKGELVGRTADVEVDLKGKAVHFGEIYNSDHLLIPEECEFQDFRIIIQKISYATKVDRGAEHKGRVLRDSVADILGYREQ